MSQPHALPAETSELAALWRMVELCLPCHERCGAATFQPAGAESLDEDWDRWVQNVYWPVLRPAVLNLQAATSSWEELPCAESRLTASLSADASYRSLAAGRRLLLDLAPPQGAKLLERFRQTARDNDASGHLAAVFAVRARVFHLPGLQVALALLLAEAVLGAAAVGVTLTAPRTSAMMERALSSAPAAPSLHVMAV